MAKTAAELLMQMRGGSQSQPQTSNIQQSVPAATSDALLSQIRNVPVDTRTAADIEKTQAQRVEALPEVTDLTQKGGGLLAGESTLDIAKISPALLTATDPREMAMIISQNFPNVGFSQTPQGEIIAVNNETGKAVSLNKPGISGVDVLQALGVMSVFTPAGRAAAIPSTLGGRVAAGSVTSGATQAGVETAQQLSGGEFNPADVGLSAAFGGAAETLGPAFRTGREFFRRGPDVAPEAQSAKQAIEGLENVTGQNVGVFPAQQLDDPALLIEQRLLTQLPASSKAAKTALERQNKEVFDATESLINTIAKEDAVETGAKRFTNAAQAVIERAKQIRAEKASPLYKEAFDVGADISTPKTTVTGFADEVVSSFPENSAIAKTINRAKSVIESSKTLEQLHGAKLEIDEMIKGTKDNPVGNTTRAQLKKIKDRLLIEMDSASPSYKSARETFASESPAVDAIEDSLIGTISRLSDEKLSQVSTKLFDAKEVNPAVLKRAKQLIDDVDPGSWDEIVRVELQRRFGALKELISDNPEAVMNTPAQIQRALFGNPAKRKVFLSALTPNQRSNFRYLEDVLVMSSKGRAQGSPTAAFETAKSKLRGVPLAVKDAILSPITALSKAGEGVVFDRNAKALAQAAFDPQWSGELSRIRALNPNSAAAAKAMTQLIDDIVRANQADQTETENMQTEEPE